MTVCNMSIEMGARGGMIAPDKVTYEYLEGKPYAPKGDLFNNKVLSKYSLNNLSINKKLFNILFL